MSERNYPREFTSLLPEESVRWVQAGLIDDDQRMAILKLYPESAGAGRDRTVLIFSILGSLLLAAGVILFFAANWEKISATIKVSAIMIAIVGTYVTGYYLQYRRSDYPRLGQALMLLGSLFYGAGIWLVAQIFHIDTHWPNGFILWGAGVLPLAWAAQSSLVLLEATALLTIWTVTEQSEFSTFNYLYPILLLVLVMPLSRWLKTWLAEGAVLAGLFLWFAINVMEHGGGSLPINETAFLGRFMLLYGVAVFGSGMARLGDFRAYLGVGSLFTLTGAFLLSFASPTYRPVQAIPALFTGAPYAVVGVAVLLLAGIAAAWFYAQRGDRERTLILPALAVLVASVLLVQFMGEAPRLVLFNVELFLATVGVIVLGISRRMAWLVNLGLLAFVIHIMTRYVDLFFSAMNKSAFFMLGGVLLLGGGWLLERNRRRWMQDMGGDDHVR